MSITTRLQAIAATPVLANSSPVDHAKLSRLHHRIARIHKRAVKTYTKLGQGDKVALHREAAERHSKWSADYAKAALD